MRLPRPLAGLFAFALSVALVGLAPAQALVPDVDPLATTVTGACSGGPGRLALTVHPPNAGSYRVEVTARGLVEGSRWIGEVVQEGEERSRVKDFRRVAVDGGWTFMTQFPAAGGAEAFFNAFAQERGARSHSCFVLTVPPFGVSLCNNQRNFIALFARERDDGSTVIGSLILNARPDSRWHLTLTATGAVSREVVEFDDRAGRRGAVRSRVVLTGIADPRLRLLATNKDRGRCFIGLDPPNVTTDAPLKLGGLGNLSALRG